MIVAPPTDQQRASLSWPGDPDLILDLDDVRITAVVTDEHRELMIVGSGGTGYWYENNERVEFGPGQGTVTDFTFRTEYRPSMPDDTFNMIRDTLCRWRDAQTPVRLSSHPDRLFVISTAEGWLPLARTPPEGP